MKKYLLIVSLQFCFLVNGQTKLTFSYDSAGNQITRILCISCLSRPAKEVKEIAAVTESDLEKFSDEDVISYYPNPLKEQLYLKWQLAQDNYVNSVHVYAMNGQVLRTYKTDKNTNQLIIPFQDYTVGVYLVLLSYNDGQEKSIKIIKQ